MDTFDTIPHPLGRGFPASRLHAHHAAQLVAAAGVTLLPPDAEFRYSSTTFDGGEGALVGCALPAGRRVRLVLDGLVLEVVEPARVERLPLVGCTVKEGAAWLGGVIGRPIVFPSWELPSGPIEEAGPLGPQAEDLRALTQWFAVADRTLRDLDVDVGTKGDVVLWPHHFDIATLVTIDPSRTIGIGLSPGDERCPLPYFYVTPWPYPAARPMPPLPVGRWHNDGWYGAMLEAPAIDSQRTVDDFLRAAFDVVHGRRDEDRRS